MSVVQFLEKIWKISTRPFVEFSGVESVDRGFLETWKGRCSFNTVRLEDGFVTDWVQSLVGDRRLVELVERAVAASTTAGEVGDALGVEKRHAREWNNMLQLTDALREHSEI